MDVATETRSIPSPVGVEEPTHPLFQYRPDLGKKVHVLCSSVEREIDRERDLSSSEIVSHCEYVMATQMVVNFLNVPKVKTPREREEMSRQELLEWTDRRRRYQAGKEWLSRILSEAAVHLSLPRVTSYGVSPMEYSFHGETVARSRIALVKIVRGGEFPTNICAKVLVDIDPVLEPSVLFSTAQRHHEDEKIHVSHSEKGTEDLTGYDVIVLEQALATGGTSKTVIEEFKKRCGGTPASLTFCFLHANEKGVRAVCEAFPDATVIVGCLHGGLDNRSYLIKPGCGDLGAEDNNVQD